MTKDRKIISVLFRVFGQILVTMVIIIAIPSSLPRFFGYDIYNIVSGSMEPAIPVGSAAYVRFENPITVEEGQVIAFESRDSIILHRVVVNDTDAQKLYTKGDANDAMDMNPISYNEVVGVMTFSIPVAGSIMVVATSMVGKIYLFAILLAGVIFQLIGAGKKENPWSKLFVIFLSAFFVVVAVIISNWYGYYQERKNNAKAADFIIADDGIDNKGCPLEVDFDALQRINPEIIGWLYCEDTNINYPICHTSDDDYYLHHAYDMTEKRSGSIFLEAEDYPDFSDTNSVVYGHHMRDGSMFAGLSKWSEQEYYDIHDHMWLLTPTATYRVELFSGYYTHAGSDVYTVFRDFGELTESYIDAVYNNSDFASTLSESEILVEGDASQKYVVFSTCEYRFENARYVLHGKLERQ